MLAILPTEATTQHPSSGLNLSSESQRAIAKTAQYTHSAPSGTYSLLRVIENYSLPSDIYYIKLLKCFGCSAVLVQCHVSSTTRAGLLQLSLKAAFSEPEVLAGAQLLSTQLGIMQKKGGQQEGGNPPPFSYTDFCKAFPFPAQPDTTHRGFSFALGQDVPQERV